VVIVLVFLIGLSLIVSPLKSTETGAFVLIGMWVVLVGPIVGIFFGTFFGAIMRPAKTARTVEDNVE
jgi:vacuolar-type H+-ATPase subunit I/STV1